MPVPENLHITVLRPPGIGPPVFYVATVNICRIKETFETVFKLRHSALSAFVSFCLPKAGCIHGENGKTASEFTVSILHSGAGKQFFIQRIRRGHFDRHKKKHFRKHP